MEPALIAALLLTLFLTADTLRRVYAVGHTANDHFVAAVVAGCFGFYLMLYQGAPGLARPFLMAGMVGLWGLFFALDRPQGASDTIRRYLGWPSQVAYAFALWGGLIWLIRLPLAVGLGWDPDWPGHALWVPLGLAFWGTAHAVRRGADVRRLTVSRLPIRIVHLSDLHASPVMHRRELDALVDQVNGQRPDLVCITGDLVMPFSEADHRYLVDALGRLEAPVFACPGNHDLPVLDPLKGALEQAGVRMLVDESEVLPQRVGRASAIEVVGLQFHWRNPVRRFLETTAVLPPAVPGSYRILLVHDPQLGPYVPRGRFDLVLSGHTHGGVVATNMFGLRGSVLRVLGMRDQGWWPAGDAWHYVHSGNWWIGLPPRMGVAGEVVVLEPGNGDEWTRHAMFPLETSTIN